MTTHQLLIIKARTLALRLLHQISFLDIDEMFYAPQCHLVKIQLKSKETLYLSTGRFELPEQLVSSITYYQNEIKLHLSSTKKVDRFKHRYSAEGFTLSKVALMPLLAEIGIEFKKEEKKEVVTSSKTNQNTSTANEITCNVCRKDILKIFIEIDN